jgi:hypothetical protein
MQLRSKLTCVWLASLLALAGCGGGGGGTPAASTVALSGSAAKGILIGAEVNVYSLAGGKKADKPLGTTTTNSMGQYTLNIPSTTDPVMIEIKAISGTKMLDETGALVGGKFPEVAAPTGLTMRSFAANASQETVVRVNPLTEMAVAVAANATGGLSINNLIAGQQVAREAAPAGVNPFTQEPVAEPASMDADQLKFAIKMAGLMSAAKADTACDVPCQIGKLSKDVTFTVAADGKATVSADVAKQIAQRSSALVASGTTSLKVSANQTNILASTGAQLKTAADIRVTTPVALVTVKPEEVLAANGLQGFVDAMRNGFRTTEERLLKVEKELDERYKDVTLEGVSFIGNVLDEIDAACKENDAGLLSCTTGSNRGFKWTAAGSTASSITFNWETTTPNLGRTSTGSVVGTVKNGMNTLTVNGRILKGTKELVAMQNLEVSLLDKGDADYRATINGTLTANDDKNLVVTLKFDGVDLKSVPRSNNPALADLTFKGGLSIAANNGDKLSGTVDLTGVEFAKNMNFYNDYQQYVTAGTINLKAVTASTNVLGLDLSVKTSMPDYTKPQSRSNYETTDGTFKLALTDSLSLSFNESSKVPETAVQAVTIKSGTSEVKLSAEYKEAPLNSAGWCQFSGSESGSIYRCATEIKLTSTNANPYTATLKRVNGKTNGDILLGTTKVGEFVNGVMKINGAEVSLY